MRSARAVTMALFAVVLSIASSVSSAVDFDEVLLSKLANSAPNINRLVLKSALQASRCAVSNGVETPDRLAVIDFSLPSSEKRLWIFDLAKGRLVLRELVAHGKNSGDLSATEFSNVPESY